MRSCIFFVLPAIFYIFLDMLDVLVVADVLSHLVLEEKDPEKRWCDAAILILQLLSSIVCQLN